MCLNVVLYLWNSYKQLYIAMLMITILPLDLLLLLNLFIIEVTVIIFYIK